MGSKSCNKIISDNIVTTKEHPVVKKPFRMHSMVKPSAGISEKFSYGIEGINYNINENNRNERNILHKKKIYDQYEFDLEEAKTNPIYNNGFKPAYKQNMFHMQKANEPIEDEDDILIKKLTEKVEELELKLKNRDLEIKRVKIQNLKLAKEKDLMKNKLKKMIREDKQKELDQKAEQEREATEENSDNPHSTEDLQNHLLKLLMSSQMQNTIMQRNMEEEREREMMEKAIQESLKENPNPDVMNYEQLQELEERIGSVSKGFSEAEISLIPVKICNSTKEDCSICLEGIKIGEEIKSLSCGHEFHKDCINECFKSTKKCPYCMDEHQIGMQ